MKSEDDIRTVSLAVARRIIPIETARSAINGRTDSEPVSRTLGLPPTLSAEACDPDKLLPLDRQKCLEIFKELYEQPPAEDLIREDEVFGRQLVVQGFVQLGQVQECLAIQRRLADVRVHPLPRLGDLLAKKGYSPPAQGSSHGSGRPLVASITNSQFLEMPHEAIEATTDSANIFSKYVRTRLLGKGGMGEVWKAWDRELHRWTALKFLRCEDTKELAHFKREAQTASKLNHPNIVGIYEIGEVAGHHFIAMQYVEGQTLATFPRDDPKLIVELVRDAALAVHAAHERRVIHRDLKPENILVEGKPSPRPKTTRRIPGRAINRSFGLRVYVTDFGLAKTTNVRSSLSVSGTIVGTPTYMSPEQARGKTYQMDARSDVYSLGVTLYELLTNRPPFREQEVYELLRRIVDEEPRSPRGINPQVAPDLETIVMKCLEKDRTRRYRSALDLAEDLTRYLGGEAIEAHPPSAAYRLRKFVGKRKALFAVGAAGALLAVGFAVAVIPKWVAAVRAKVAKERELAGEKEKAQVREEALKELGTLWMDVVLAVQGFYRTTNNPTNVRGNIEKALARVSGYVEKHPDYPQGYYVRARGKLYLDDLHGAEEDLRSAIRMEPAFAPGEALLGQVLLEQFTCRMRGTPETREDRLRAARPLLLEAQEHLARWTSGAERRSILEWGLMRTREDEVAELLVRGMALYYVDNKGSDAIRELKKAHEAEPAEEFAYWIGNWETDPTEKIRWYTTALTIRPHYARAYLDRGAARGSKGEFDGAIEDLTKAIEINPGFAEAYHNRGGVRCDKSEFKSAIEDFTKAIGMNSRFAEAYANRGFARDSMGDCDGAITDCTKAIEIDPRHVPAYITRSIAHGSKGDFGKAIEDFTKAIEINPGFAEAYYNRGLARGAKGDLDGAIADYMKAIEINPRHANAYSNLGTARKSKGDLEGAIADATKAIEIDPNDATAHFNRGAARQAKGDADGAIADCGNAIKIDPQYAPAYLTRGVARRSKGDFDGAIADYTKAIEVDPKNAAAYVNRGNALMATGNLDGAIWDYAKALEVAPPNWPYRKQVETLVQEARVTKAKKP